MNQTSINALALAIQVKQPVILVGMPGIAKTKLTYAVCRALGLPFHVINLQDYAQEDIGGFPAPDFDRGFVRKLPDELFANLEADCVIVWDEFGQADEHKQGAANRVIYENHAGTYPLPEGTRHVLTTNPPEQSAGGTDITPPSANRLMWIPWMPDTKVWFEAALRGVADAKSCRVKFPDPAVPHVPEEWYNLIMPQLTLIVAYGRARQDVIAAYPKTHVEACGPWPSFRSWESVAVMDAACQASGLDDDVRLMCFSGLIGNARAMEYLTYLRELDLPDTEDLLRKPDKFKLPPRGDQRYAILASVTGAVVRHFTDDRYHAAWKIFDTARAGGAGDIAVASASSLAAMHKHLKGPGPRKEMEAFLPLLKKTGLIPA